MAQTDKDLSWSFTAVFGIYSRKEDGKTNQEFKRWYDIKIKWLYSANMYTQFTMNAAASDTYQSSSVREPLNICNRTEITMQKIIKLKKPLRFWDEVSWIIRIITSCVGVWLTIPFSKIFFSHLKAKISRQHLWIPFLPFFFSYVVVKMFAKSLTLNQNQQIFSLMKKLVDWWKVSCSI